MQVVSTYLDYTSQILELFIPREEVEKISNSLRRMRGNYERKKIENSNVSKLELKHIILYYKFWLLKTSIGGNFNYKYICPMSIHVQKNKNCNVVSTGNHLGH